MFVKVTNGVPEKYTLGQLRRDNPNVSFPKTIPEETLLDYGVHSYIDTPQPSFNPVTHSISEEFTTSNGAWYRTWSVAELPAEQVIPLLISQIAYDRYAKESSGLIWTDLNSSSWFIDTTIESQNRLSAAVTTIQSNMRIENSVWKCADTQGNVVFRPTTHAELVDIAQQVQSLVQKCFDAEAAAYAKLQNTDFTADFNTEFNLL